MNNLFYSDNFHDPNYSYAENLNLCIDNWGDLAHCANNCLGVDPNAVVIAGSAVLAATAIGGIGIGQSLFGVGAITTLGAAGMVAMGMCPPPFCEVDTMF